MKNNFLLLLYLCINSFIIYSQDFNKLRKLSSCPNDSCFIDYLNKVSEDTIKHNPDYAYQIALKASAIARKINYKQGLLHAIYNIAYYHMYQYNSNEAIEIGNIALELAKILKDTTYLAKTYNVLGISYSDAGKLKESTDLYKKALHYASLNNNKKTEAKACINMGVSYYYLSDYNQSTYYYLRGLKIIESFHDTAHIISTLNNLASVYSANKSSKEALKIVHKALNLALQYKDPMYIADCHNNLFAEYFRLDSLDKALYYLNKASEYFKQQNDLKNLTIAYNNYSTIYTKKQNYEKALEYSIKALNLIRQLGLTSEEPNFLYTLANTYFQIKNYHKAIDYGNECLKLSKLINKPDLILKAKGILAQSYFQLKQYENSAKIYEQYIVLKDSIYKADFEKNIAEMATKYEVEKKENELIKKNLTIEKQEKENKIQRLLNNLFLLGIFSLFVISALIFRSYKQKKKANAIIVSKNKQLELANEEISNQKKEIESQRDTVIKQKNHIEAIHKDLTDSINYAERIQRCLLASQKYFYDFSQEFFILYNPKDIISGDFYWVSKNNYGDYIFVTADCTGHGVPGAIMSILIIKTLEQAIDKGYNTPADILNYTRQVIISHLQNDGSAEGGKDGMDASIICFSKNNNVISYAAAHNPIWIYRNNQIIELECDRMPVGKHEKENIPFMERTFEILPSDIIYTFTDGYADQFGGPKGKKFTYKQLKETIIAHAHLPLIEQKNCFQNIFNNWKIHEEQIDDVTLIGIKIT
ncbi:MAG: tetratricopeptide repeat protein [Bacteroidales bacterium]|nr:tetratricopeptide repeat protein [Bacteroidales bacterium]